MSFDNGDWLFIPKSDIGHREQQQDRVAVFHSANTEGHLLVLADGMGGHENGAWAAQTVIDIAQQQLQQQESVQNPAQFLRDICFQAHQTIGEYAGGGRPTPGSTCVILYLTETEAHWVHVGDSRLYHFREGKLLALTNDHSADQLAKQQVDETGSIQNHLYMCLGGDNEVSPDYDFTTLSDNDFFLLCSDGFWNQIDVKQHFSKDMDKNTLSEYLETLVKQAKQNHADKSDNISLLVAYGEPSSQHRKSRHRWFRWFKK